MHRFVICILFEAVDEETSLNLKPELITINQLQSISDIVRFSPLLGFGHHARHSDCCGRVRTIQWHRVTFSSGKHVNFPYLATRHRSQHHQTSQMSTGPVRGYWRLQVCGLAYLEKSCKRVSRKSKHFALFCLILPKQAVHLHYCTLLSESELYRIVFMHILWSVL